MSGELVELVKLVGAFLAPIFREGGKFVADRIRFARVDNAAAAFVQAQAILSEVGLQPRPVPLKLLVPIAEGASLEEEDEMTARWGRLLASASAGIFVPPSFPRILAELTAADALILDQIASRWPAAVSRGRVDGGEWVVETDQPNLASLLKEVGLPDDSFRVSIDILIRLRLIVLSSLNLDDLSDMPMRHREYQVPGLTDLGIAFVRACAGPRRTE